MKRKWSAAAAAIAAMLGISGCGSSTQTTASVQSVAMICGFTTVTQSQQFAGIVSTGKEENISKDSDKRVAKVEVKVGDIVKEGQVLFTYDSEQAQNSLEKAKLDLEELNNTLTSKQAEKTQLETDKTKAAQSEQLDYTLKIQETDTDIRETNYNIALKEKEIKKLEESTKNLDVKAPFGGRIERAGTADASTGSYGTDDDGTGGDDVGGETYGSGDESEDSEANVFIKIVEMDNYRIKGTINEQNINDIMTGMDMIIYSRLDESQTWSGTITEINTQQAEKSNNDNYYYGGSSDEMTQSSKYPFYVKIDSLDGLMIGQHVYMRADNGDMDGGDEIRLDASFINDADSAPWVWAESESGLLEKRGVTVDEYDESDNTWLVTDGLTGDDYIAPQTSSYEEGMPCIENNNDAFEAAGENGDGEYADADGIGDYGDEGEYDDYGGMEDGEGDFALYDDEDYGDDGGYEDGGEFEGGGFANGTFGGGAVG